MSSSRANPPGRARGISPSLHFRAEGLPSAPYSRNTDEFIVPYTRTSDSSTPAQEPTRNTLQKKHQGKRKGRANRQRSSTSAATPSARTQGRFKPNRKYTMPGPNKDATPGSTATKPDGRNQNGNRQGFRTDSAISNKRYGNERALQPWNPETTDGGDGCLESSTSGRHWDQFAENERLFGLTSDYDESIYTTSIDKSHPQYKERYAAAEKKAREIERSAPATSHVAEERVMDHAAGKGPAGETEEDKYSGVRRQDFPPLSGARENRYMPPAKRAPMAHSTVKGVPVDPAIISSQIKAPPKKQSMTTHVVDGTKNGVSLKTAEEKTADAVPKMTARNPKALDSKAADRAPEQLLSPGKEPGSTAGPHLAPTGTEDPPSATLTVERDVLQSFKSFASQQRMHAEKARSSKIKADKEVKLHELKNFANSFKLSTPVPTDLVSIIAKDPAKQKEIQAKAMRNAEDVARRRADAAKEKGMTNKTADTRMGEQVSSGHAGDRRSARAMATTASAAASSQQTSNPTGLRHGAGPRQPYGQQPFHMQPYRNNRGGAQHPSQHPSQQQSGGLAQRLRHVEQQRFMQPLAPGQHQPSQDVRAPPTGPSGNADAGFSRRLSGAPSHMSAKLNPNSHEFRPSPFAASFNPNGYPSASSSPRAPASHVSEMSATATATAQTGQLIRRKTNAVDVDKCNILTFTKSIAPPPGRNYDDNGGLRPPYDTPPTWRQLQDDEKAESTMHLTYKEYFERQPFSSHTSNTPNPPHVVPQIAHQHQLPFHLQHSSHNLGPRQSPHMPPMQMHTSQQVPAPHPHFGGADDHRMLPSHSAQSFASPRMAPQMPVSYPNQLPYGQQVFMNPQMTPFRAFPNSSHYGAPQQGQMSGPVMMQPQFMTGPHGMVGQPPIMYHGGPPQFLPQSGPPQPGPGTTGYPSPGRPTAPLMVHQGSQQGQPLYGISPGVQYNQPAYGPGHGGGPSQ